MKSTGGKPDWCFPWCILHRPEHRSAYSQARYCPGSIAADDIQAIVAINPFTLYEVQADGAVAQTSLGMTIDLVQTQAGSTVTGNSGLQADASTASVGGELFKIVDFVDRVGSSVGDTYTEGCIVMMNMAENVLTTDAPLPRELENGYRTRAAYERTPAGSERSVRYGVRTLP